PAARSLMLCLWPRSLGPALLRLALAPLASARPALACSWLCSLRPLLPLAPLASGPARSGSARSRTLRSLFRSLSPSQLRLCHFRLGCVCGLPRNRTRVFVHA
ncbi:hypothetical protein ACTXT7_017383, partial [Hymenolepis weldensis]